MKRLGLISNSRVLLPCHILDCDPSWTRLVMTKLPLIIAVSALSWILGAPPCCGAEAPLRVLMIHSFGRDYAPFHVVAAQFRTELARRSPHPVEFVETSLELARFDGVDRDAPLVEFLRSIFKGHAPDLVVPVGGRRRCSGIGTVRSFSRRCLRSWSASTSGA